MDALKNAIRELTDVQIDFICAEVKIDKDTLFSMSEDELDGVYDIMCDIEVEEVINNNYGDDTERCILASDIVTFLGNAFDDDD